MKRFVTWLLLIVVVSTVGLAQSNIMQPGAQFHGIRDFREVMPKALYRGGANNGHGPLTQDQLKALCEDDIGTAIYLYTTGFQGNSTTQCSKGKLDYIDEGWEGAGRTAVHKQGPASAGCGILESGRRAQGAVPQSDPEHSQFPPGSPSRPHTRGAK